MKILITLLLALALPAQAVTLATYQPKSIFTKVIEKITECKLNLPCYWEKKLGTSLYSITGSTLISDLDTYIMQNDNALNAGKIENSTTSLPDLVTLANLSTVGTITTGTWSADAIAVAKGGTGTTSPAENLIMFGNGASGLKILGFGASGQFLTSAGAGAMPAWSTASIDETASWNFTGTTFRVQNLYASSTIVWNGLSLSMPSTITASSTGLMSDASGNLSWGFPTATTTVYSVAGSYTWRRTAGVNFVEVEMCGAGGGGGAAAVGTNSHGGGGGSSTYARAIVQVTGDVTVTVGAGGTGGSAGENNGSAGTASSFAGAVTVTAPGGGGGAHGNGTNGAGGSAGSAATNADFYVLGRAGANGERNLYGGTIANTSGQGADNLWGKYTAGVSDSGGGNGVQCSGGSGGGNESSGVARAGGNGGDGVVLIRWLGTR